MAGQMGSVDTDRLTVERTKEIREAASKVIWVYDRIGTGETLRAALVNLLLVIDDRPASE